MIGLLALAAAGVLGDPGCAAGRGPAVLVTVEGMKDRKGDLKLEAYPPNAADFLQDDTILIRAGRFFRRVREPTPQAGPVRLCIGFPRPGRYALLFTHNRDGKNKFSFWTDGAGLPSNLRLGRARPKLAEALIDVGPGVGSIVIRAQYLKGLGGFGPLG